MDTSMKKKVEFQPGLGAVAQCIRVSPSFSRRGAATAAVLAYGLGAGFMFGMCLGYCSDLFWNFGLYLVTLSLFHMFEYLFVATFHADNLTADSFLLNHSVHYSVALASSLVEYAVRALFFPEYSCISYVAALGALITFGGLVIRIIALFTAKHNFTHWVANHKCDEHVLVTDGIYGFIRHPGYMGWFWWSVGSQIMCCNVICIAGFFYASYRFFSDRIVYEEAKLINFFGDDYRRFREKTPTYIPLIK